jgi:hypothetical protein
MLLGSDMRLSDMRQAARWVYSGKTAKAALVALLLAGPASACIWHDHSFTASGPK